MWLLKRKREDDSQQAVNKAIENLERTQARSSDVQEVSQGLRTFRERNHIAEQLASIMGGLK